MADGIVYIDHSDIRPGKVEDVKRGVTQVVDFVRMHEPRLLFYGFYIDEFCRVAKEYMAAGHEHYTSFIEPGNVITTNERLGGGTVGTPTPRSGPSSNRRW